jgi:hypothetical protein
MKASFDARIRDYFRISRIRSARRRLFFGRPNGNEDRVVAGKAADDFRPPRFVDRPGNCGSVTRSCLQHDDVLSNGYIFREKFPQCAPDRFVELRGGSAPMVV